jgi:hypothetical protein
LGWRPVQTGQVRWGFIAPDVAPIAAACGRAAMKREHLPRFDCMSLLLRRSSAVKIPYQLRPD